MPTLPAFKGNFSVGFKDLKTPTHLSRLYYPWLPSKWKYSKGYGDFLNLPLIIISLIIYPILSFTSTRSTSKLSLATHKFPVVVFSHGLGGMRTTYSQLCGNLASRGFIVISVEHGDGSACFTTNGNVKYLRPRKEDLRDDEGTQEYLLRLRRKQVDQRRDEVVEWVKIAKDLNEGRLEQFIEKDGCEEFRGRLDFENIVMVGHSFGYLLVVLTV
jgi:platelet-activating factor acetylhydrolase